MRSRDPLPVTPDVLRQRLDALPRFPLASLPTPLEELPRLSAHLGGPRLFVKRDDLTGLALGGNKTRMLEYRIGELRRRGVDTFVQSAALQSNEARQGAAACARAGLHFMGGLTGADALPDYRTGNLLLMHLFGAELEAIGPERPEVIGPALERLAERARAAGRRPCVFEAEPLFNTLGAVSYVNAYLELREQIAAMGLRVDHLLTTSHDTTQAGLLAGARALGDELNIVGNTVRYPAEQVRRVMSGIAGDVAELLGLELAIPPEAIHSHEAYIGPGYPIPSPEGQEALRLVARLEGLLLDPAYTAKTMVCLMDQIARGAFRAGETLVFLHTGGHPALFIDEE